MYVLLSWHPDILGASSKSICSHSEHLKVNNNILCGVGNDPLHFIIWIWIWDLESRSPWLDLAWTQACQYIPWYQHCICIVMYIHKYPRFIGVRLCGNESSVFLCYITELPTVCILSLFGCLKKERFLYFWSYNIFLIKIKLIWCVWISGIYKNILIRCKILMP